MYFNLKKKTASEIFLMIKIQRLWLILILILVLNLALEGLARADSPGSLDTSFDGDGKVITEFGGNDDAAADLIIQPNGKIVTVGYSSYNSEYDVTLARYNSDGTLDTSFDGDGKVTTNFGSVDMGSAVAIQSDNKIVVVGYIWAGISNGSSFLLARYSSDGSLDPSFDGDGRVMTNFGANDVAGAIAIQSDGKIVVAGGNGSDFVLGRYNIDGSLDTSFDSDGKVMTDFGGSSECAQSIAIQSNGKILVTGSSWLDSNSNLVLARYNSDGSLDTSFDSDGKVITDFGGYESGSALIVQPDGKIIVAGSTRGTDFIFNFLLIRYNNNGSLDTSFGVDGKVTTDFVGFSAGASAVTRQPDGKIVVAGNIRSSGISDFALVRYNSDGSLNTSFGIAGKVTTDFGGYESGSAIAIQTDGKIVVTGYSTRGGNRDFALARYWGGTGPSLSLTKQVQLSNNPIQPGNSLTYTIVVANNGDGIANGVVITDELPSYINGSNLYQTTDITAGASLTFTVSATLANQAPIGEVITNTAVFSHISGRGQHSAVFKIGNANFGGDMNVYLPIIIK
jgi:uncharacterized delta-60 repeat protein/uncharacterized repeat protein (TIGR01451 family)